MEEKEPLTRQQVFTKILHGVIAIFVILGIIYVYGGIQQLFFFQSTSPKISSPPAESTLNLKEIEIPLNIFAIRNDNDGTRRQEENIKNLIEQNSNIWNQADVTFSITDIVEINLTDEEMRLFLNNPSSFISNVEGHDSSKINVFLTRRLSGLNGVAFTGINTVAVADITTTNDFRVLAHEMGHIFGLDHTTNATRLMYQGSRGTELTEEEILRARGAIE